MLASRSLFAVLFVTVLACVSCLPKSLTDQELKARIADAGAMAADSLVADADSAAGATCGDKKVQAAEQCDDGNAISCDGCASCSRRTALDVNSSKSMAIVTANMGPLLLDGKTSFSYELWFKLHKLPGKGFTSLIALGMPKDDKALGLMLGLSKVDAVAAALPSCSLARGTKQVAGTPVDGLWVIGTTPVLANSWHHMRCVYSVGDERLRLSVDGGPPQESKAFADLSGKPSFSNGSMLAIGAIPAEAGSPEPFSGLMDEVRIATGQAAENWKAFKPRYAPTEPGTVLLYHMDSAAGSQTLLDATANKLHADQSPFAGKDSPLSFVADTSCFDFQDKDLSCPAAANPPWCK